MSNTAKLGFFVLIVIVALAAMITWKSNIFLTKDGYELIGSFKNIEGLTLGSELRYRGLNVGKIMQIDPGPYNIKVFAIVRKDIIIPKDSKLRVGFDGLVGQKYLEVVPGTSEVYYTEGENLEGMSTSGIVDFVDIGAQNLIETKKILETFRNIIDDPKLQAAFKNSVYTAEKAAQNIEKLANELRKTNAGIMAIVADSNFQASVKGTMKETNKTLSSANNFFESVEKIDIRPSADIQYGTVSNSIRGNLNIQNSPTDYLRIGIGEGPTRNLSLLDLEISRRVFANIGMRLGMINTFLGGGIDIFPDKYMVLSTDLYDFNNPKPNVPKIRTTASYKIFDYVNFLIQADDIFNSGRNYSVGVKIKGVGE
ncbi:hypothetical protein A2526_01355 [candidate division WOR-1 bacterium RIFOXYD2_FULL_36_8]|uniref:Mce/MlaD domain-containing protein n=1 Tax=candidate division WOR-1 bacterium RIFOXYB2_FULL_36_35 TaxID=1802578 RepID=A0A1F4S4P8_UNCSA|nr:MAG: hypothetical protein A2230_07895 [candidate division WOR-1 bacterium RIFOXYA2_FULL_36_21]OGC14713.1 MAG: hypothetical protein A2290_00380 [candidate division WOR-1 bacterium RIFOXYB2_FULL_36_35]OGC19008.1 MAG: hypothetical protein A2282_02310 [candidate division WOR-1 bacterium RIFOXYA12_FULL_36_13]OGC37802.1 MAG: hypothetical protein A2526_01355 [candidate division WOR-1 bacterium RIFOXYD2_FULL_36_8]